MPTVVVRVLCLLLPAVSACFDKLTAPPCASVPFSQASVSGDTITTTTGLRYIEGAAGAGIAVDWCRTIAAVHYDAFLLDGTPFDSMRDADSPLEFTPGLGQLIDGFEQGVVGMRRGGTRRLIIPPGLGFGSEPRRNASGEVVVPANSTVIYDIEIVAVTS